MPIMIGLALLFLTQPALSESLQGVVRNVVDGDTIDVSNVRIRICGIDAPEHGEPGYEKARAALSQMIKGRTVNCIPVGAGSVCDGRSKRFNHKRLVAQCLVGGKDIAAWMVKTGHACDWVKFSGGAYPGGCRK